MSPQQPVRRLPARHRAAVRISGCRVFGRKVLARSLTALARRHQLLLQVGQCVVCLLKQGSNVLAQRFNGCSHLRAQEHCDVASVRQ
jgi:hypothetical protein